jgi:hypothetical protein
VYSDTGNDFFASDPVSPMMSVFPKSHFEKNCKPSKNNIIKNTKISNNPNFGIYIDKSLNPTTNNILENSMYEK